MTEIPANLTNEQIRKLLETELNIYICKRYSVSEDNWKGALIIAAESEQEAVSIYEREECDTPKQIMLMKIQKGILYDDELR